MWRQCWRCDRTCQHEQLAERVIGYASQIAALTSRMLDCLAEFVAGAEILVHQIDDQTSVDEGPILRSAEREELECGATVRSVHHVRPWSAGGTTDPDNLILLCGAHHRALHHSAFGIVALGHRRFAFRGTHGGELVAAAITSRTTVITPATVIVRTVRRPGPEN